MKETAIHATYEELRRLAGSVRRGDPGQTLNPTALVNEAWIKLAASPGMTIKSRLHFKRIAARAMRQVLLDPVRRRNADKCGGGEVAFVTFDQSTEAKPPHETALAIDALQVALSCVAGLA